MASAVLQTTQITSNSARIRVSGLTIGQVYEIYVRTEAGEVVYSYGKGLNKGKYIAESAVEYRDLELKPDTTYVWRFKADPEGENTWTTDAQTFKTEPATTVTPENPRPENWTKFSNFQKGQVISISANLWKEFQNKIDEFRRYTGRGNYTGWSTPITNHSITPNFINQCIFALQINEVQQWRLPNQVDYGDIFYASILVSLQEALNSIP